MDIDTLRGELWSKVMLGRSTQAVQAWFSSLLASSIPELLKQRPRYWDGKIDRWGGPYIKRVFTAGFKGICFYLYFCTAAVLHATSTKLNMRLLPPLGNSMGEVSFAAVLRWVTRVDDFTRLLVDTCEHERVIHLQRNEEAALAFLNWRAHTTDHFAVVSARQVNSDYACFLFSKQLRLVS